MQLRYERFIGVRLRHDWYRDGVCRDLAIMPTTSTSIVLAAHRVRLLRCAGGVTLVGPTEPVPGGSSVALYPLAGGARLVFALCPTEPTFAVFTELPTDGGRSRGNVPRVVEIHAVAGIVYAAFVRLSMATARRVHSSRRASWSIIGGRPSHGGPTATPE